MKIRIKEMVPEDILPWEIAEKLVGCEISLSTMANPDGDDLSKSLSSMMKIFEIKGEIKHEVGVEMILLAIRQEHGETVHNEIMDFMVRTYGGAYLMSTVNIPITYCKVIPD
jgi:hypothetical protein